MTGSKEDLLLGRAAVAQEVGKEIICCLTHIMGFLYRQLNVFGCCLAVHFNSSCHCNLCILVLSCNNAGRLSVLLRVCYNVRITGFPGNGCRLVGLVNRKFRRKRDIASDVVRIYKLQLFLRSVQIIILSQNLFHNNCEFLCLCHSAHGNFSRKCHGHILAFRPCHCNRITVLADHRRTVL